MDKEIKFHHWRIRPLHIGGVIGDGCLEVVIGRKLHAPRLLIFWPPAFTLIWSKGMFDWNVERNYKFTYWKW